MAPTGTASCGFEQVADQGFRSRAEEALGARAHAHGTPARGYGSLGTVLRMRLVPSHARRGYLGPHLGLGAAPWEPLAFDLRLPAGPRVLASTHPVDPD